MNYRAALLALALLPPVAASAFADTRAQFCSRMNNTCVKTCPAGRTCDSCAGKLAACRTSGCFAFERTGTRCESEPMPTCSEQRQRCVSFTGNEAACAGSHAACMKTGRWVGGRAGDLGAAQKR